MDRTNRTWTKDEAAAYLGCQPDTLRVWVSKRKIPYVKIGRLTRFLQRDLDEWIDTNRVSAKTSLQIEGGG